MNNVLEEDDNMDELVISFRDMYDRETNIYDISFYDYSFSDFSLSNIQNNISENMLHKIFETLNNNLTKGRILEKTVNGTEIQYVADVSDKIKKRIKSGELAFVIDKINGRLKGDLRDTKTGQLLKKLDLTPQEVNKLGRLPELASMQAQLKGISQQLEALNFNITRIEQGQYNDRYAGYFSARQMLIESMLIENDASKKQLIFSAIQSSNETIGKMMLTLRADANTVVDYKIKQKEINILENKISESLNYLNQTVQLNILAYTLIEEPKALLSAMANYRSFLEQTLLKPIGNNTRSLAWKIDNGNADRSINFSEKAKNISKSIEKLVLSNNMLIMEGEDEKEKSENDCNL